MRSDKDKRTETEKDIDDFLSKFESPSDGSAADYSTYLEHEETAASNGPSFNWKDVESDDLTQESGSVAETAKNAEADNEKETDKISPDKKSPKKNEKKQIKNPARITAQDKEEIKKEIREELEEELKEEVKEEVKEPAPYKAGRKKRRNKDVRKTSLSIYTDSPATEEKSFDDHKNDTEKALIEKKEISVISEDKEDPVHESKEDKKEGSSEDRIEDKSAEKTEDKEDKTEDHTEDIEIEKEKPETAASRDIEDVAKAVLVSGAGSDMSKYGKNKKRSGRKKSAKKKTYNDKKPVSPVEREVRTDKSPSRDDAVREVIKDTSTEGQETKPDAGKQSGNELFSFSRKKSDSKKTDAKKNKVKKPVSKLKDSALLKKTSGLTRKLKKRKGDRTLKEFLFLKPNPDYDPSKGDTYEKDGRTVKNKKNKVSFLKILGNIAAVFLVFVLAGMIYALGCIISAPKYDYKDIYSAVDTASVIYDDQGELIDNVFYTENRKIIKYEDMPEDLVNSFIAIEDKTFWKHHGFNWTRMIGAIISSLTGNGKISGTSTITQQLARNVYLADTKSVRSIKRKLLEMYYAGRLEHALTKEQIVEAYLNTIYLGHGCYGVNAAARTYFSKDVQGLDLIECASLAALPQSPDTYALLKLSSEAQDAVDPKVVATEPDTIVTNDIAKGRRQLTLDLMLEQGMISQAEHDKVYGLSLNDFINPTINNAGSDYSYFHEYMVEPIINDLMEQRKMTYEDAERMVYTRGLQIYSTIDSTAQKVIVEEFKDDSNFPYVDPPRDGDGNMLNSDGEIA
ncbi:MAG: transglycosylase domain-containing protein, partial [Mogibacterium sp.]|nr:transglycosylase domain-containing protein [Mogibacterium sp.]